MNSWINTYRNDGFSVVRNVLSDADLSICREVFRHCLTNDTLLQSGTSVFDYFEAKPERFSLPPEVDAKRLGMYIVGNPGELCGELKTILALKSIWELAAAALSLPVRQVAFGFLNFTRKPARYGPSISFHRDYGNRFSCTEVSDEMLRVIIPLCSSNKNTGGTSFVPGSHLIDDKAALHANVDQSACQEAAVSPDTNLGDVIVFHSKVLHGGGPNTSPQDRVNIVLQFVSKGARHRCQHTGEPFLGWTVEDFILSSPKNDV